MLYIIFLAQSSASQWTEWAIEQLFTRGLRRKARWDAFWREYWPFPTHENIIVAVFDPENPRTAPLAEVPLRDNVIDAFSELVLSQVLRIIDFLTPYVAFFLFVAGMAFVLYLRYPFYLPGVIKGKFRTYESNYWRVCMFFVLVLFFVHTWFLGICLSHVYFNPPIGWYMTTQTIAIIVFAAWGFFWAYMLGVVAFSPDFRPRWLCIIIAFIIWCIAVNFILWNMNIHAAAFAQQWFYASHLVTIGALYEKFLIFFRAKKAERYGPRRYVYKPSRYRWWGHAPAKPKYPFTGKKTEVDNLVEKLEEEPWNWETRNQPFTEFPQSMDNCGSPDNSMGRAKVSESYYKGIQWKPWSSSFNVTADEPEGKLEHWPDTASDLEFLSEAALTNIKLSARDYKADTRQQAVANARARIATGVPNARPGGRGVPRQAGMYCDLLQYEGRHALFPDTMWKLFNEVRFRAFLNNSQGSVYEMAPYHWWAVDLEYWATYLDYFIFRTTDYGRRHIVMKEFLSEEKLAEADTVYDAWCDENRQVIRYFDKYCFFAQPKRNRQLLGPNKTHYKLFRTSWKMHKVTGYPKGKNGIKKNQYTQNIPLPTVAEEREWRDSKQYWSWRNLNFVEWFNCLQKLKTTPEYILYRSYPETHCNWGFIHAVKYIFDKDLGGYIWQTSQRRDYLHVVSDLISACAASTPVDYKGFRLQPLKRNKTPVADTLFDDFPAMEWAAWLRFCERNKQSPFHFKTKKPTAEDTLEAEQREAFAEYNRLMTFKDWWAMVYTHNRLRNPIWRRSDFNYMGTPYEAEGLYLDEIRHDMLENWVYLWTEYYQTYFSHVDGCREIWPDPKLFLQGSDFLYSAWREALFPYGEYTDWGELIT